MKSLLPLFILLCLKVSAQDPNFSQFFVSPLTLNPALTGKFSGSFRVSGNYRDQWPLINKAFITNTSAIDFPVLKGKLSELDTWGVGIVAMTDKTAGGLLSSNLFSLTTAYHKGLDENGMNQLGAGFQLTYNSKMLDGTRLNFEDELDAQGGWSIPSMETINDRMLNMNYMDVSAGVLFNGSTDGYNNYYLGFSGYHLNKPRESFTGDVFYTLMPRYTMHAGGAIPLGDATKTIYLSSIYSTQGNAQNFVGGGALGVALNDDPDNPATIFA